MTKPQTCPKCGSRLSSESVEGNCPRCLLGLGLGMGKAGKVEEPSQDVSAPPMRYFGDYELRREIAHGGMGVVYEARQMSLNRLVALKMILAGQLATPAQVHRFRLEAEAAARLDHPNIVPIYEIGEHEGRNFYSMKLLSGGRLGLVQLALAQSLPASESRERQRVIARAMAKVAAAVHFAHQHGILHRDLKPTNILLDSHGEPLVSDFGLAKLVESEEALTLSGAPLGTPGYMSPEQAAGHAKAASTASDIYSLGAILYELLTGRPPFAGQTVLETIRQVQESDPVPPRTFNALIAQDLETICLKCLQKQPAARYPSASALAEDLERWMQGKPIMARPVGVFEKLWSRARADPKLAALVIVVLTSLMLITVGSMVATVRIGRVEAAQREDLYRAYLAQARAERLSGQEGQRFAALEAINKASAIHRTRALADEAIAAIELPDLRVKRHWRVDSPEVAEDVRFDENLKFYAARSRGGITVRSLSDHREVAFFTLGSNPEGYTDLWAKAFDRYSRYFAAGCTTTNHRRHFLIWNLSRAESPVLSHDGYPIHFSADGRQVFLGQSDGSVDLFDLASGRRVKHLREGKGQLDWSGLEPSKDGKYLACFGEGESAAEIWELESRMPILSLRHTNELASLAWNDDGSMLATGCRDGEVSIWRLKDGTCVARMFGQQGRVTRLAFNHGGHLLATGAWDATVRLWDVNGGQALLITRRTCPQMFFGADDSTLVYDAEGADCELLEVAYGTGYQKLFCKTPQGGAGRLSFAPDGRVLAAGGGDCIRFWDTLAGQEIGELPSGECASPQVVFDGSLSLVGGTAQGFFRWPMKLETASGASRLRVEAPQLLLAQPALVLCSVDQAGQKSLIGTDPREGALVLDLRSSTHPVRLGPHPGCWEVSLDPSGQWAATATWKGTGVKIWDAHNGELVRELPVQGSANVAFSPDGRWLVTANMKQYRFWKTDSWQTCPNAMAGNPILQYPPLAFSPDSSMLAVCPSGHKIQIVRVPSFQEVVSLSPPQTTFFRYLLFSPDGARLAGLDNNQQVHLWDLRTLQAELRGLGFSDVLPRCPTSPAGKTIPMTPLQLDLGPITSAAVESNLPAP